MKKALKILGGFIVLLVVAFLGIGFAGSPTIDQRYDVTVDAPVAKVWAVVNDPNQVTNWMPIHSDSEKIVEVKTPGAAELMARAGEMVSKGNLDAKKLDRHTYVHKNGGETTVEVVDRQTNKRIAEHVVADTTGMQGMFPDMTWGFELAEAEGGKTKLTPFMMATAAKPHGTFMCKVMDWSGMHRKYMEQMAKNVETLAKGGKVQ